MKKYKTKKEGNMLRIIALKNFFGVKKGDIGGLIEKEENLSQEGICWVYPNAVVSGNAKVFDNAWIEGNAEVYGYARVCGNARVYGNAKVYGFAWVSGKACVSGNARIYGNIKLWSTENSYFFTSIKDSKDYVILRIKKDFYTISLSTNIKEDYLKNIQTIRQLYEKEI